MTSYSRTAAVIAGLTAFISAGVGNVSALPTSNLTAEFIENSFYLPFWFVALMLAIAVILLAVSFFKRFYTAIMLDTLTFLIALYATGASFVTGDLIRVTDEVYTIVLYQSSGTVWFSAGLAILALIMLVINVFDYTTNEGKIMDKKVERK